MLTALSGLAETVSAALRRREVAQRHAALEVVAQLADVARPVVVAERREELLRPDARPASGRRSGPGCARCARRAAADRAGDRAAAAASPRRRRAGSRGRSGTCAPPTCSRRLRFVAAMRRTLTGTWLFVPTRRTSRRSSTRSSLGCRSMLSSPISSRKTVPPAAASNTPRRDDTAPVKAPRSWPKSSLSSSCGGIAPQSTTRNGLSRRRAAAVDRLGRDLLARARLALEQDRRLAAARPCRGRRRPPAWPSSGRPCGRSDRGRSAPESARLAPASASKRTDPSPAASAARAPCGPFPTALAIDRCARFLDRNDPERIVRRVAFDGGPGRPRARATGIRSRRRSWPRRGGPAAGGSRRRRAGARRACAGGPCARRPRGTHLSADRRRMRGAMPPATKTPPVASTARPRLPATRAQDRTEERERHLADGVGAREAALGDLGGHVVSPAGRASDGGRVGLDERAAGRLEREEREDVDEAVAREHALAGDAAVLRAQVVKEPGLERRARREVGVAALGRRPPRSDADSTTRAGSASPRPVPAPSTAMGPCGDGRARRRAARARRGRRRSRPARRR